MKECDLNEIFEKYKEGESTLHEENILFDNAKNLESSLEAWSVFAANNKIEMPKDFNNNLWKSFEQKTNRKRKSRFKIAIMSAAAAIILMIAIFIGKPSKNELSYDEKAALLNEALSMFSDYEQAEIQQKVIYENETIIIYTSNE